MNDIKIGRFNNNSKEFIVNNPNQKKFQDNYLFNKKVFSYVTHTGMGYSRFVDNNDYKTSIIHGTNFGAQYEYSRIIYIRDNDTSEFWSVGWEPVCKPYEEYSCEIGLNYNIITNTTNGVKCIWKILVPSGAEPVEMWDIQLTASGKRNLSVFLYTEISLQSDYPTYGNDLYSSSVYEEGDGFIKVTNKAMAICDKTNCVTCMPSIKPNYFTGSRNDFFGLYRSGANPFVLQSGENLPNTVATKERLCGAFQFDIILKANKEFKMEHIIIAHNYKEDVQKYSSLSFDDEFLQTKEMFDKKYSKNQIKTGDDSIDRMMNIWGKHMSLFGTMFCRWGIKGYRDVLQHCMGTLYSDIELAKDNIIKSLKHQYSNGFAVRSFPAVHEDSKMQYNDSATWLIFAITEYIKETGEFDFLDTEIPFLDEGSSTVIERLDLIIESVYNDRGENGLIRMRDGDWNDSFTHVGKEKIGESVWLSMFIAKAILLVDELKTFLNCKDDKYQKMYDSLKESINQNAWDGDWYTRAINDKGEKIGSKDSKQAKIFLNTQSWAIISGVASDDKIEKMLNSIDKYLLTKKGYVLNFPEYTEFDANIGRVTVIEPGTCENATVYMHGNAFMLWAFLISGKKDKALELLHRINPDNNESLPMCPYVYANCYYGPSHRKTPGAMEHSWITGSVNWILLGVYEMMLGVKRTYGDLEIKPMLSREIKSVQVDREFRNEKYKIIIDNDGVNATCQVNKL